MVRAKAPLRHSLRRRLLAIAALVACVCFAAPATAAPTSPPSPSATAGGAAAAKATFGIGPANVKGLDGRPTLTYLVSPGSRVTDYAAVTNYAIKAVTLSVYVADATVTPDGQFGYLARAAKRVDAATWISAAFAGNNPLITLGPRATAIVPIIVTVPIGATPGDHAAGVITSLTSKVTSKNGEKVDLEQRVALRTYIRVSGPLHPKLSIEHLHAKYHATVNPVGGGTATVTYTVRNTGNVSLRAHQQVVVSGLLGTAKPRRALVDVPLLLPNTSAAMSVSVPDVWPQFRLRARVTLVPLVAPGDVDPGLPTKITASTATWAIPWLLLAALVLLLCAAGLWLWLRRRTHRPPAAPPSGRHRGGPVGPDDDGDDPARLPDAITQEARA